LLGDRLYAIVDPETGKVASAKHPEKRPGRSGRGDAVSLA
jgi:hypothetical protein